MTIEGNWLSGAMKLDYPNVKYKWSNCRPARPEKARWPSVPAGRGRRERPPDGRRGPREIPQFRKQQLTFADAFGVMPSRTSTLDTYARQEPDAKAWVDSAAYAQGPVTIAGFDKVLSQFNTDLQTLSTTDPKTILAALQRNGEQALTKGN